MNSSKYSKYIRAHGIITPRWVFEVLLLRVEGIQACHYGFGSKIKPSETEITTQSTFVYNFCLHL